MAPLGQNNFSSGLAPAWLPLFDCPFDECFANSLPLLHAPAPAPAPAPFPTSSLRAVILCRTHKLHKQMEREGEGKGKEGKARQRLLSAITHVCIIYGSFEAGGGRD